MLITTFISTFINQGYAKYLQHTHSEITDEISFKKDGIIYVYRIEYTDSSKKEVYSYTMRGYIVLPHVLYVGLESIEVPTQSFVCNEFDEIIR